MDDAATTLETQLLFVHGLALQYFNRFLDPAFTAGERHQRLLELKPRDEDFERVFQPPLLDAARGLYSALWSNPPPLRGKPEQTELWVRTARSEDFVAWNRRGSEFPGGYRKLAPNLMPNLVWLAFKLVQPGEVSGLSFDGVVWLDRFVWFPQPWRLAPMGGR